MHAHRLCIVQDDVEHKQRAINHMDVVYMNAYAVIIAGAGPDTNAGLPGILLSFIPSTASIPRPQAAPLHIPLRPQRCLLLGIADTQKRDRSCCSQLR